MKFPTEPRNVAQQPAPSTDRGDGADAASTAPQPAAEPDHMAAPITVTMELTQEAIAAEAYALYEARGYEDGHDIDDWVDAERRLREQQPRD